MGGGEDENFRLFLILNIKAIVHIMPWPISSWGKPPNSLPNISQGSRDGLELDEKNKVCAYLIYLILCVFAVLCVYCCFFIALDAGLLARSQ